MNDRITYDEALELIEKHWGWPCATAEKLLKSVLHEPIVSFKSEGGVPAEILLSESQPEPLDRSSYPPLSRTLSQRGLERALGVRFEVPKPAQPSQDEFNNQPATRDKRGRHLHKHRNGLLLYAGEYFGRFTTKPRRSELINWLSLIAELRGWNMCPNTIRDVAEQALDLWIYPDELRK
jgi:hypothetical protein